MTRRRRWWEWRSIVLFAVVTAVAFGLSVWAQGLGAGGVVLFATVGFTLGLVAAPELMPRRFRFPAGWRVGWAVTGSVAVAYQLDASSEGYAVAVMLGGILGWSSPWWIDHITLP